MSKNAFCERFVLPTTALEYVNWLGEICGHIGGPDEPVSAQLKQEGDGVFTLYLAAPFPDPVRIPGLPESLQPDPKAHYPRAKAVGLKISTLYQGGIVVEVSCDDVVSFGRTLADIVEGSLLTFGLSKLVADIAEGVPAPPYLKKELEGMAQDDPLELDTPQSRRLLKALREAGALTAEAVPAEPAPTAEAALDWFPKKPETRDKWKRATEIIRERLAEQAEAYEGLEADDLKVSLEDLRDTLARRMGWKPTTRVIQDIRRADKLGLFH